MNMEMKGSGMESTRRRFFHIGDQQVYCGVPYTLGRLMHFFNKTGKEVPGNKLEVEYLLKSLVQPLEEEHSVRCLVENDKYTFLDLKQVKKFRRRKR